MPYIPAVPPTSTTSEALKTPLLVTLAANGATATVAGATYDPTFPLQAIAVQLQQIQASLNGGTAAAETKVPGSLLNILASSSTSLASIDGALQMLILGGKEAVGSQFTAAHSVQSSLATIASLMTTQIATQQLAVADQIKHNQFTQLTTNTARAEAGKEPIEVKPEAFQKQVKTATSDIATVQAQTALAGVALGLSTDALKAGLDISKNLIASTDIGQTLISWGKTTTGFVNSKTEAIKASADAKAAEIRKKQEQAKSGQS